MNARRRFNFNVWPVVQRELREGARRPVNHRLRFGSALGATALLWFIAANSPASPDQLGGEILLRLHTLLLALIFLIIPALPADSIAREQREGTMGLLLLTPLRAGGIVAGKAATHVLRGLTFWFATLPVLAIPFLIGGLSWFDTVSALSLQFSAFVLCLAAGLLASSLAKARNCVFFLAYLFAAAFWFVFAQLFLFVLFIGNKFDVSSVSDWWNQSTDVMVIMTGLSGDPIGWDLLTRMYTPGRLLWKDFCLVSPFVVLLLFWFIASVAARRLKRFERERKMFPRLESWLRACCPSPLQARFRRDRRRLLEWNPIAWLQQYSWHGRGGQWLLCAAFLLIELAACQGDDDTRDFVHASLLIVLAGIYTFVGVGSFLEEKRSGALELLLVTPISVNKLILGRLVGLWCRFLPAALVLAGSYLVEGWIQLYNKEPLDLSRVFFAAPIFMTLPVFSTCFALRIKNLMVAAILTWISLAIPVLVVWGVAVFWEIFISWEFPNPWLALGLIASHAAFALLACLLLRRSLSRRIYSF